MRRAVLSLTIGMFAGLGCLTAASGQELQEVNVMTVNEASCSPYPQFTGLEFGFFEDEGLKVNLLASSTSIPYVAFLANGDADLVMLSSGEVLQALNAGQPVSVVYEAYQAAPEGIVVSADSEIEGLAGLKGKTIGLAADEDRTTTIIALETVGLTEGDVTMVVVGDSGPTIVSSLTNGSIDAFAGSAGERGKLEAAGYPYRNITPIEVTQNPGNSYVVWGPTVDEKRELISRFLRAWAKAQHSGVVDTNAVMDVCRKHIPEQWEDPAAGTRIVMNSVYNTQLRRTHRLGELQPDVWTRIQPPYVKVGVIDKEIDPETFLDGSFIEAANDFTTQDVKQGIAKFKAAQKAN